MIRKRPLVLPFLALLAGCSSAPSEHLSSSAAAVNTTMPFSQIPGATGVDVGSDSLGISWVATSTQNNQEYSWSIGTPLSGTAVVGETGVAIDVGAQGAWTVNTSYGITAGVNGVMIGVAGAATDVGVSPDGNTVYVVGVATPLPRVPGRPPFPMPLDYPISKWVNNAFVPIPGASGLRVDAANDGSAYVVDHTGAVWHVMGTVASPVVTYFGPNGTNATDVTVGADGTVFVVGNNGAGVNAPIYVYDPTENSWDPLPGALGTRVSASSATVVTVVNSAGTVWTTEVTCGEANEPPCSTTEFPSCNPTGCDCDQVNLTVVGGICTTCGANGEVACAPIPSIGYVGGCIEGSVSTGGTCGPCGNDGQPACQANSPACNSGTQNVNQICECGAIGQIYCFTGNKCDSCASGSCPLGTNPDGSGVVIPAVPSGADPCTECGKLGDRVCTTGAACSPGLNNAGGFCIQPPPPACVAKVSSCAVITTATSSKSALGGTETFIDVTTTFNTGECQTDTNQFNVYPLNVTDSVNYYSTDNVTLSGVPSGSNTYTFQYRLGTGGFSGLNNGTYDVNFTEAGGAGSCSIANAFKID